MLSRKDRIHRMKRREGIKDETTKDRFSRDW